MSLPENKNCLFTQVSIITGLQKSQYKPAVKRPKTIRYSGLDSLIRQSLAQLAFSGDSHLLSQQKRKEIH